MLLSCKLLNEGKRRQHAVLGPGISDHRDYRCDLWIRWSRGSSRRNCEAPVLHFPGGVCYHLDHRSSPPWPYSWDLIPGNYGAVEFVESGPGCSCYKRNTPE